MTEKIPEPKSIAPDTPPQDGAQASAGATAAYARDDKRAGGRRTPDSSYQSSLFAGAGTSDAPAWSDSTKGRMLIRLFSRGVVGAAFFVAGSRMASMQLNEYHPEHWKWDAKKPLQAIAKGIDVSLGKGLEKTIELFAGIKHGFGTPQAKEAAKAAVTFRESRAFKYKDANGVVQKMMGRSYGADIVGFTFDFAMMSIGDASARNVIQLFDPNVKQSWKLNANGEPAKRGEAWHFAPAEFGKWLGKTTWRIFTKNQGEDWAAAIPYAFQMKFQRQFLSSVLNKRWDGHQLVFDRGLNGGAYRINQQGKIVGDYQLVGALDLHARFTGYNWYTLMFREGYDAIGRAWNQWKENDYKISLHLPEHFNPITSPIDGALHAARYVTKSFLKANLYMNPACLFFWTFRVPQSKWRGQNFIEGQPLHMGRETGMWGTQYNPFDPKHYEHFPTMTLLDKFEKGFSKTLNPIGQASNYLGVKLADGFEHLHNKGFTPKAKWVRYLLQGDQSTLVNGGRRFAHEYVDAMAAYTPYTIAKTEFSLRVDDNKGDGNLGQMDAAWYRFMDDVAAFNFRNWGGDIKHIIKLATNFERDIKVREGGDVETKTADKPVPESTVHASTVHHHDPAMLNRNAEAANDKHYHEDHRWAKRVAGSDINPALVHAGSRTMH